jgi:hypothetical protein
MRLPSYGGNGMPNGDPKVERTNCLEMFWDAISRHRLLRLSPVKG